MKRLVMAAMLAGALTACGDAAEEADDTATAETAAVEETVAAESSAGTYEYEFEGKPTTSVLLADGTYEDTQDGEVIEKGMWADRDGKVCFDPEGDDTLGTCYATTEPDAAGVFTATSDDGATVLTIKKTS